MTDYHIVLPSKPKILFLEDSKGTFEIEGLYPGYGHTLGNSLRRIMLSSIPGAAVTNIKIDGADHEFSTVLGVAEDVLTLILNLKNVRFHMTSFEPQTITLSQTGKKEVVAEDFVLPGGVELANPKMHIATLSEKNAHLSMEVVIQKGFGYVPKEQLAKEKVSVGDIPVDAIFTPVRIVNCEVENMRVGNRTDFNRLRITIETDGTISPREVLETAITTMIRQLSAIIGFKEEVEREPESELIPEKVKQDVAKEAKSLAPSADILKIRVEDLNLSVRTMKALAAASIRTVGGLARKTEDDLLVIDGLGVKGVTEIKRVLSNFGMTLR